MHLFYDPHIVEGKAHTLSEEESKHAVRVLRLQIGNELKVLDGKGGAYACSITEAHPKRCTLAINERFQEVMPSYSIHIAVSPTKQMERMEWFIEKATEIGITEITFLRCSNSERVQLKPERLEKKAISAMKQSQRLFLPKINGLVDFSSFLQENSFGLLAHCSDGQKNPIASVFKANNCPILIGPEGDFS
ncbi:MAG: hypothetical protein A3D92_03745, partial [Bacteroidetes bacterium RIFCSPHIGHO2_02_FULL_44_7]